MAKKPAVHVESQEEELVVTVVRFKGSGETARKGIEAVSQALAAAFGQPSTRQITNGRKATPVTLPTEAVDADPVEDADDDAEVYDDESEQPTTTKGTLKPRKLPKFDSSLAVTPFKAFAAERNPQTVDEKYLVACLWLQESAQLVSYGASQVFTCFRAMDWPTYDDFTQPMRQLKKKRSYFADTEKRGDWKLNDHGLDEARKIKHAATA